MRINRNNQHCWKTQHRSNESWFNLSCMRLDTSGNTAAEYAIMLAIVIGVALMGTRLLGNATGAAFGNLFSDSKHNKPVAMAANDPSPGAGDRLADEVSGFAVADLQLLLAELVAMAALAGLLYTTHAIRKRRELLGDDEEVPAVAVNPALQHRLFQKRQKIYHLLQGDMDTVLASQMKVRHIMSHRLTTVLPGTGADELRDMMKRKHLRHLLVCDPAGLLVGILSDRDILRGGKDAADMMTANPITVKPDTPISPAVTQMIDRHISCLPVVDKDSKPCAVLTSTDLMMALQCALQVLHKMAAEVASDAELESDNVESTVAAGVPESVTVEYEVAT